MPVYEFIVSQTVVVVAEDEVAAREVVRDSIPEFDWQAYDVEYNKELTIIEELVDGWNGDCLPWGGDGKTPLKDILSKV